MVSPRRRGGSRRTRNNSRDNVTLCLLDSTQATTVSRSASVEVATTRSCATTRCLVRSVVMAACLFLSLLCVRSTGQRASTACCCGRPLRSAFDACALRGAWRYCNNFCLGPGPPDVSSGTAACPRMDGPPYDARDDRAGVFSAILVSLKRPKSGSPTA